MPIQVALIVQPRVLILIVSLYFIGKSLHIASVSSKKGGTGVGEVILVEICMNALIE